MQSSAKTTRSRVTTLTLLITLLALAFTAPIASAQTSNVRADTFAVEVAPGVDANQLAAQMGFENLGAIGALPGHYLFRRAASTTNNDAELTHVAGVLGSTAGVINIQPQYTQTRGTRLVDQTITDPRFRAQWHLDNTGQYGGTKGNDARVVAAWDAGYTGAGVVVASVDDGVFWNHPDLAPNYDAVGSYDFVDYDADPMPTGHYSHGTSVAGVMAAAADGSVCGVGVAFNAKLSGVRLPLDHKQTDAQEAMALNYALQYNDIYNSSWGPLDTGRGEDMQAPGPLTRAALQQGIRYGRGGLGAIYVWAAGNGRRSADNTNADGYASSIYTIAVTATDYNGMAASYSEPGASILINAPSSGPAGGGIRTTASGPYVAGQECTENFGGTSSASPLVAGTVALMLQANPNLTWRDVQHILVNTGERNDPANADWTQNAAGHWINHDYGFGRVNSGAAADMAKTWLTVNPQYVYRSPVLKVNKPIPSGTSAVSTFTLPEDFAVEHVEIAFTATHPSRGQLDITLISPGGTVSKMMANRTRDTHPNYTNWKMMTVRNWDERAQGQWTLMVTDRNGDNLSGTFDNWQLTIYGSKPPVSGELLRNTGFEKDKQPDGLPDGWKIVGKRAASDRLRTNQDPERVFAFDGNKSLQLRGKPRKNLRLIQKPDVFGLGANDSLHLSGQVMASNLSAGLELRAVVRYVDPALPKAVISLPIDPGSYDYTFFNTSMALAGDVKSVRFMIRFKAKDGSGVAYLDNVSLVAVQSTSTGQPVPQIPDNADLLPLPAAPEMSQIPGTLRGGN